MRTKKQVDVGRVINDRPKRGAAASAQNTLQSPVLNILSDPDFTSAEGRSSPHTRDATVDEGRKALSSAQPNVPSPVRSNAPEKNKKSIVKGSAEYQSRLQTVQQVCDAIDAEVKSRSATIRALAAAQYSSFKAQLDWQLSKFSADELNMPLEEYLKTCPGIKAVTSVDGRIQLLKRSSPYPKLEESKRNLQDLLTKVKDGTSKGMTSLLFTPCAESNLPAIQSVKREHETRGPEQKLVGEELSWPEYYMRLQSLGYNSELTPSLGSLNKMNTPMTFKSGLLTGVTPKTLRLPKHGETMLSINGSPLGQFGKIPASAGGTTRITRTKSRLASSKRSLRDL